MNKKMILVAGVVFVVILTGTIAQMSPSWSSNKNQNMTLSIDCKEGEKLFNCECRWNITEKDVKVKEYEFWNFSVGKTEYVNYTASINIGGYCIQGLRNKNITYTGDPHDAILNDLTNVIRAEDELNKKKESKKAPAGRGTIKVIK